jgi:hypothetical protein
VSATLLIHPENAPSLANARPCGFDRVGDAKARTFWRRPVTVR